MRIFLFIILAALSLAAPGRADQILGAGRIDGTGRVLLPGGPMLGTWAGGKFTATSNGLDVRQELTTAPTEMTYGSLNQNTATTAEQIYRPQYSGAECAAATSGCAYFTVDGVRSTTVIHPGALATNTQAFGGYVANQAVVQTINGVEGGNGVIYFGEITCGVQGSACWGINTGQVDDVTNGGPLPADATPRKLIGYEADISVRHPSTIVQGIALVGSSSQQPAGSNGYTCGALGVSSILWDICFVVPDGTTKVGLNLGSMKSSASSASSSIDMYYRDASNARQLIRAQAVNDVLQVTHGGYANGLAFVPAQTGQSPSLLVIGTDAVIGLDLRTVGGGGVTTDAPLIANGPYFQTNGTFILGPGSQSAPASSSAACTTGTVQFTSAYIYICVATNSWRRSTLATF